MNTIFSFEGRFFKKDFLVFFLFFNLLSLGMFFWLGNTSYFVHAGENRTPQIIVFEEEDEETVNIFPPRAIKIVYDGEEKTYITHAENVGAILNEFEIDYSEYDIIFPSVESNLHFLNTITVESVLKELKQTEVVIPFEIERIYDENLNYGNTEILQHGINGLNKEIYEYIYINKELVSEEKLSSEVVEKPKNQIMKVGTKMTAMEGRNCSHWNEVVDNITNDASERDVLKHLIKCESGCNAGANNSNTYIGLLQFSPRTFNHYSDGGDIWNGEDQIKAALKILKGGGLSHHWPSCANSY